MFWTFACRRIFRIRRFTIGFRLSKKLATFVVPFCVLVEPVSGQTRFCFSLRRAFIMVGNHNTKRFLGNSQLPIPIQIVEPDSETFSYNQKIKYHCCP